MSDEESSTSSNEGGFDGGENSGEKFRYSATSVDSVKEFAESLGVDDLVDDAAKELTADVTFRLKQIVLAAIKLMKEGRRSTLSTQDIDNALKLWNIEPIYGNCGPGGKGLELPFIGDEDEEAVELTEIVGASLPEAPEEVCLRSSWLVAEPLSTEVSSQQSEKKIMDIREGPSTERKSNGTRAKRGGPFVPIAAERFKLKRAEKVFLKRFATLELSLEQQLYYKEITEACVGIDEARRIKGLQSLSHDPGIYLMAPRLATFIAEGVKVNAVQRSLALLIYFMRMVQSLLKNESVSLRKYLHEIIPSICTCIVGHPLCVHPEVDNHWVLREYASKVMAQVCKKYATPVNRIETRVTKIFVSLLNCERAPLSPLYGPIYGAIAGLGQLGNAAIETYIIPKILEFGNRFEAILGEGFNSPNQLDSVQKIKTLIVELACPTLKTMRKSPDLLQEYEKDFGDFFAPSLHMGVTALRKSEIETKA